MKTLTLIFLIYYITINLIGFFIMGNDKKRAIRNAYRISEATLFFVALIGGALGTTLGMKHFRHKTRHWYFAIGMPLIFFLQVALMVWVCNYHISLTS